MKNLKLTGILLTMLILLAGCIGFASAPAAATTSRQEASPVLGPDELDSAIREASNDINSSVPAGIFIGVVNIQSASAALSEYVIDELIGNAVRDKKFTVLDRQRLDQIRQEQNFQLSGEVDDEFALSIGRLIGIQTIITGTVSPLGNRYRITIRALDVETGAVQVQFNKNIAAGETITALMGISAGGTAASASAGRQTTTVSGTATMAGQTAASPAPAQPAGTYNFWPRVQAYENGIPMEAYIFKVIVRGRYMIIYISDTARGPYNSGYSLGFLNDDLILTNLDRPSLSWKRVGGNQRSDDTNIRGLMSSFENAAGSRFSLEGTGQWRGVIFEEINLANAEYEP